MAEPYPDLHPSRMVSIPILVISVYRRYDHQVTGIVKDVEGNPVDRDLVAINRISKQVIGSTRSDPVTGEFTLPSPNASVSVVALAEDGSALPDLVVRVTPVEP